MNTIILKITSLLPPSLKKPKPNTKKLKKRKVNLSAFSKKLFNDWNIFLLTWYHLFLLRYSWHMTIRHKYLLAVWLYVFDTRLLWITTRKNPKRQNQAQKVEVHIVDWGVRGRNWITSQNTENFDQEGFISFK